MFSIFESYDFLSEKIPESKRIDYFSNRLRNILSHPQKYIFNYEIDLNTSSSLYYFEHIKDDLIKIIASQVESKYKIILLDKTNSNFNDVLYKVLIKYNLKDLIIPFFIWLSYHKENSLEIIINNMEFLKSKDFKFKNIEELYNLGRGNTFFRLPYINNSSNKDTLKYVSSFMRNICSDLSYKKKYFRKKEKNIRIGFISERLKYDSSVLRDRYKIIENLNREKFTVFIFVSDCEQRFTKSVKGNFLPSFFKNCKHEFIFLPKSIIESRKIIDFINLDILVYCEIGMDFKPYLLSFSRLAKTQINTWGHSETSGIDTIDYFISSKLYEQDYTISKNYYSEKLILCDSLCTCYPSLKIDSNFESRENLGFTEQMNIYSCLQASFKITQFMEDIISNILEKDENGIVLLSVAFAPFSKTQLIRFYKKLAKNSSKIKFYKTLSLNEYLNLVNISDIVLDTYPFGGCNSSLEALYLDKPIITLPSNKLSGRFTYGFYNYIGFNELIVESKEEYIKKAITLTSSLEFKNKCIDSIKKNKDKLFNDLESVKEWQEILFKLN